MPNLRPRVPVLVSVLGPLAIAVALAAWLPAGSPRGTGAEILNAGQRARLARLDVPFVANAGQTDPRVAYYAHTMAGTAFVTRSGELVLSLAGRDRRPIPSDTGASAGGAPGWVLVARPVTRQQPQIRGEERTRARVTVLRGSDPKHWGSRLPGYRAITLGQPWAGIGYTLQAHGANVEQLFTVAPGASAGAIRMAISGARALRLKDGALVAETGLGPVRFSRPRAFQLVAGQRRAIAVAYVLAGDRYGFRLGRHDPTRAVVIDPLIRASYLGGSSFDSAAGAVVAPDGDVYVAGQTQSADFPGTTGGAQPQKRGLTDAFIAEFNPSLTTLLHATYLGGSNLDYATAIALGPPGTPLAGDVYVIGDTRSEDFPGTSGGAQPTCAGTTEDCNDNGDGFVAVLSGDLGTLLQASYLGGTDIDDARALALAPAGAGDPGAVYVAGRTISDDFPATGGGAQPIAQPGSYGGFIAALSPDLTEIVQATYLGGTSVDEALAVAYDSENNEIYAAGDTSSADFPCTLAGAPPPAGGSCGSSGSGAQSSYAGAFDAFVAALNADLTGLIQSSYVGGSALDQALTLATASGGIYIAGQTYSSDLPAISGAAQPLYDSNGDGFLAKVNPALTAFVRTTYLGGSGLDAADALALGPAGQVYVAGSTQSTDFPCTASSGPDPNGGVCAAAHAGAQPNAGGGGDAYSALLSADLGRLTQASYLGGGAPDQGNALALAPASGSVSGNVYLVGLTNSVNFPGTAGAAQPAYAGSSDAYAAVLSPDLTGPQLVMTLAVTAPATARRNTFFTYNVDITNTTAPSAEFDGNATGVVFTDVLPPQVTVKKMTSSQGDDCTQLSGVVSCNLGTIAANGGDATVTVKVLATNSGSAANAAFIRADQALSEDSASSVTTTTSIPFPNSGNGGASGFGFAGLLALAVLGLFGYLLRRR
ncbi:MAG TPA: hypothetical protein VFX38_04090 [Gammaproteobacteria bacterium]|nr:hypothetical protein [Gammaproteobacteria bacterium]